ncbi:hypothetical protein ABZ260_16975 [Streptosporangium sp. NPDC006013]|uniref:hypothetical protein n=1 Tax=Streptosporangium sp. NPDC006013 TaxID=3155596 RepID=UPI0033ADB7D5
MAALSGASPLNPIRTSVPSPTMAISATAPNSLDALPLKIRPAKDQADGRFEVPAARRAGRRTRPHMFIRKSPIKKNISDKPSSKGDEIFHVQTVRPFII